MLIPRYALQKSIEGGFKECQGFKFDTAVWNVKGKPILVANSSPTKPGTKRMPQEAIVLEIGFWKGLQRSLGWREWWDNAHQFYDLMLAKKSVDGFWEKVLKD
jgi:hypothetical protein